MLNGRDSYSLFFRIKKKKTKEGQKKAYDILSMANFVIVSFGNCFFLFKLISQFPNVCLSEKERKLQF